MEGTERSAGYSIVYLLFVGLIVFMMSFINSFLEQRSPSKQYVERSYKSVGSNKSVDDLSKVNVDPQSDKVDSQAEIKNETKDSVVSLTDGKGTIQTNEHFFSI